MGGNLKEHGWEPPITYTITQPDRWENPVDLQGNCPETLRLDDQLARIEGKRMARGGVSIIFSSDSLDTVCGYPRGETLQKEIKIHKNN